MTWSMAEVYGQSTISGRGLKDGIQREIKWIAYLELEKREDSERD